MSHQWRQRGIASSQLNLAFSTSFDWVRHWIWQLKNCRYILFTKFHFVSINHYKLSNSQSDSFMCKKRFKRKLQIQHVLMKYKRKEEFRGGSTDVAFGRMTDIIIVFSGLLLFHKSRKKQDWGTPCSCQDPGSTPETALVQIKMKLSAAESNCWDHTWLQQADSEEITRNAPVMRKQLIRGHSFVHSFTLSTFSKVYKPCATWTALTPPYSFETHQFKILLYSEQ